MNRMKCKAHVDGGRSGGSSVCRPGSEDPHRRERKFHTCFFFFLFDVFPMYIVKLSKSEKRAFGYFLWVKTKSWLTNLYLVIVTSTKYYILILTNRQNAETGSRGANPEKFRTGKYAVDQLVSMSLYVYSISQSSSSKLTKLSKKL